MFFDFFPYSVIVTNTKGGYVVYVQMWIPRYIDMSPHFSQTILNKGIFQMWIHHYIDMNPHKSKHIKVVYL